MKNVYLGIIALLVVAFGVSWAFPDSRELMVKSLFKAPDNDEIPLPKKKANAKAEVPLPKGRQTGASDNKPGKPGTAEVDTTSKNILFIGDSMLEGLKPRLAAYAEENGHKLNAVIWYSSTSEIWGRNGAVKVREYIKKFKPDYIFISLGGNELFVKEIKDRRKKYVEAILHEFGNIPYVWIGPPNWKPDTGINDLLAETCAEGSFYLSYTPDQHYDRTSDGAHPTRSSAALWMDRICQWVMTQSAHPIKLNKPSKQNGSCHTEMLQPST